MLKVFFFETEEKMLAIFAVLMSAKTGQLLRKGYYFKFAKGSFEIIWR